MYTYYYRGHWYGTTDVPPGDAYEPEDEEEGFGGEPTDWDEWRRHVEEDL